MSVQTEGPIRGLIARWIMRLEAAGGILRMAFLGVTAASTLTSALALIGLQDYAPYVLVAGVTGTLVFAFTYVELGVFNRKNRARADHGNNFSRPDMIINGQITGATIYTALHGEPPSEEERKKIEETVIEYFQKHRNGVDVDLN